MNWRVIPSTPATHGEQPQPGKPAQVVDEQGRGLAVAVSDDVAQAIVAAVNGRAGDAIMDQLGLFALRASHERLRRSAQVVLLAWEAGDRNDRHFARGAHWDTIVKGLRSALDLADGV